MLLHRVGPVDLSAAAGEPYHPAFVPRSTGHHRIDNLDLYDTLYLSRDAPGAVAERFGTFPAWGDWLTDHPGGHRVRLTTFDLDADRPMLDLDHAAALVARSLKPSRVVTRNRTTTQAWAAEAFAERTWSGVAWWSYYDPDWSSCGLWCPPGEATIEGLTVSAVEDLHADHPAIITAGAFLMRTWI